MNLLWGAIFMFAPAPLALKVPRNMDGISRKGKVRVNFPNMTVVDETIKNAPRFLEDAIAFEQFMNGSHRIADVLQRSTSKPRSISSFLELEQKIESTMERRHALAEIKDIMRFASKRLHKTPKFGIDSINIGLARSGAPWYSLMRSLAADESNFNYFDENDVKLVGDVAFFLNIGFTGQIASKWRVCMAAGLYASVYFKGEFYVDQTVTGSTGFKGSEFGGEDLYFAFAVSKNVPGWSWSMTFNHDYVARYLPWSTDEEKLRRVYDHQEKNHQFHHLSRMSGGFEFTSAGPLKDLVAINFGYCIMGRSQGGQCVDALNGDQKTKAERWRARQLEDKLKNAAEGGMSFLAKAKRKNGGESIEDDDDEKARKELSEMSSNLDELKQWILSNEDLGKDDAKLLEMTQKMATEGGHMDSILLGWWKDAKSELKIKADENDVKDEIVENIVKRIMSDGDTVEIKTAELNQGMTEQEDKLKAAEAKLQAAEAKLEDTEKAKLNEKLNEARGALNMLNGILKRLQLIPESRKAAKTEFEKKALEVEKKIEKLFGAEFKDEKAKLEDLKKTTETEEEAIALLERQKIELKEHNSKAQTYLKGAKRKQQEADGKALLATLEQAQKKTSEELAEALQKQQDELWVIEKEQRLLEVLNKLIDGKEKAIEHIADLDEILMILIRDWKELDMMLRPDEKLKEQLEELQALTEKEDELTKAELTTKKELEEAIQSTETTRDNEALSYPRPKELEKMQAELNELARQLEWVSRDSNRDDLLKNGESALTSASAKVDEYDSQVSQALKEREEAMRNIANETTATETTDESADRERDESADSVPTSTIEQDTGESRSHDETEEPPTKKDIKESQSHDATEESPEPTDAVAEASFEEVQNAEKWSKNTVQTGVGHCWCGSPEDGNVGEGWKKGLDIATF